MNSDSTNVSGACGISISPIVKPAFVPVRPTSFRFVWNVLGDAASALSPAAGLMIGLPFRVVFGYGLPGLIAALPVIPVAVLLPSWYASDLGLGFLLTGLVLGAARIIDLASDLLVGTIADRIDWYGYRYKPLVLAGALIAGAGLVALALPPAPVTTMWLGLGSIVLFTGWTLMMVPYTAWGAELSHDHHERSRLTASREAAGLCGMLIAITLPLLAATLPGAADVAPLLALSVAAIAFGVPAMIGFALLVPEPAVRANHERFSVSDIGDLWRLREFRRTLTCWFVNGIANGLPAVLFPIVVQDYFALDDSDLYGLLVCYFGAAVVAMPLWLTLARRYGKVRAWKVAIAFNVLVFAQVLWLDQSTAVWFIGICIASGMTLGADLALPPSLQADILERDRQHSGRRRTATAFALWSMATKLALAVAIVAAFAGLGLSGRGAAAGSPPDPAVLLCLYVVLPVALKCAVIVLLGRIDTGPSIDTDTSAQQL